MNTCPRPSLLLFLFFILTSSSPAQTSLREKIGQMIMVTFTGDSLEKRTPSIDTLLADIADKRIGGVIFFTWSGNLKSPAQIRHLTDGLQQRTSAPLLIATDQEGGNVARLSASNGFAATPTAYSMGTVVNTEANTRSIAATMAGWFEDTGINMNLAPVVDLNVNPTSPAIGAYGRSFSAAPTDVTNHASWFMEEFHKRNLITTLKHFPGHGSAVGDSHLGFTDVTTTWSSAELQPYQDLIGLGAVRAIMTAHVFNAGLDTSYPATLSRATMTDLLRTQLGFQGVVVSDAMSMAAISAEFGFDESIRLAVNAGVDILLYTRNLENDGSSLAGKLVNLIEADVVSGEIPLQRIDESYARIMLLKQTFLTSVALYADRDVPGSFTVGSFPNPFNNSTTIQFSLPERGHFTLRIFDLLGREISLIHDGPMNAGHATMRWSPDNAASGTYIVRADLNGRPATHRLLYIR